MTDTSPSPLDLMLLHEAALFLHDERARITAINERDGGAPPRFYLARTVAGNFWRFHATLPDTVTEALHERCLDEPAWDGASREPTHREAYVRLLSAQAPIRQVWSGPAYRLPDDLSPTVKPVAIGASNADLLRGGLDDWVADASHRSPFLAVVEGGRAASICASVRITPTAHEAGVETAAPYRGRGHAVEAVAGWARAVRCQGALPLYSTSWDNAASQRVAAKLGARSIGADFHVT